MGDSDFGNIHIYSTERLYYYRDEFATYANLML